jgi:hypothetical protein
MSGAQSLRRAVLDPDDVATALQTPGAVRAEASIPDGAERVDAGWDVHTGEFYLTFKHRSFNLVPEGHDIPTERVEVTHD